MSSVGSASFMSRLSWRYAAKAFDPAKKLPDELKNKIIEAARMAPTSFGLQPFELIVVSSQNIKDQIKAAGWNQPQFSTAQYILCFVGRSDVGNRIEEYMHLMTHGKPEMRANLKGFEDAMKNSVGKLPAEQATDWAARQAYIALGFAMAACAELEVDSCPMEGFDPTTVGKILNLKAHERVSVMLPIGYREGTAVVRPKVRFPLTALVREV